MNFGKIKNLYTHYLIESQLNNDDKGKKLYKKFLKTLKESEILKTQFLVYKNIETPNDFNDADVYEYLKENISLFNKFKKEDIIKENKKLVDLLVKEGFDTKLNKEDNPIYSDLHKLITTQKKGETINKLHESFTNVKKYLTENKKQISLTENEYVRNIDPNKFLELTVKKFNEKYSNMTEEEKKILKTLQEGTEEQKRSLVMELSKGNISLINEKLKLFAENTSLKESLLNVKDMVYSSMESDNFNDNIVKMYDLKNELKD